MMKISVSYTTAGTNAKGCTKSLLPDEKILHRGALTVIKFFYH